MSKLLGVVAATGLALFAPAAGARAAAAAGPEAACTRGADRPAILVRVVGLKSRTGVVRVQAYDDPRRFFDKGAYVRRIDIRPPAGGPIEVCVPVAHSGTYAISVRHDVAGDGKADSSDGGGMSGNPHLSLADVIFKRKPAAAQVAVHVGGAVALVPVVVNYVHGLSFGPIDTASR